MLRSLCRHKPGYLTGQVPPVIVIGIEDPHVPMPENFCTARTSPLAHVIRRSVLSEGCLGKTRSFVPCARERR